MQPFRCPSCDKPTISARRKWASSSMTPVSCPECHAAVYISGRQSSLWRSVEALLLTLIIIRSMLGFSWSLIVIGLLVIAALEAVRLYFVPLVTLRYTGLD